MFSPVSTPLIGPLVLWPLRKQHSIPLANQQHETLQWLLIDTTALLCFKWANSGIQDAMDKSILLTLMATHVTAGLVYARKGIFPPLFVYGTSSLLMGVAALKGN